MTMRIGSLFSGIGGLELGLERAGVGRVVWQVERDPFCRRVLAKHWPEVERFEDVREVGRANLAPVDVLCGGFPCQDISSAGRKRGIGGAQSGLWSEFARIIGELRPAAVVIENSADLAKRGLLTVLRDLAFRGFDAEWSVVSACSVGAPHLRRRLFVLAYANAQGESALSEHEEVAGLPTDAGRLRDRWNTAPERLRVAHGVPARMDRLRALGNAVVPQVAEVVGRRLRERLAA